MRTLELFSGTKSFSKVAAARGYGTYTVDNDKELRPNLCADILKMGTLQLPENLDILWASPPCTAFSVASIGHHWTGGFRAYEPKTDAARLGVALVEKTFELIQDLKPKWWFIENPRGVLRKLPLMGGVRRVTVWYCRYGDRRAKPTDIWTNVPEGVWKPRGACRNGHPDHERAPRGSRTGTQGLKGARERGAIPTELFNEIFDSLEKHEKSQTQT